MQNDQIHYLLQSIWFSGNEAKTYILCQQYWKLSIANIARIMWLPRSTINDLVQKMLEKKYLTVTKWTQWRYFSSISPDDLIILLKNKQNEYEESIKKIEILKPLMKDQQHIQWRIPKIKYFEGNDSVQLIISKTIIWKEKCYLTDIDAIINYMGRSAKKVAKEFSKNEGFYREILVDTKSAHEYVKEKDKIINKKNYKTKYWKIDWWISSSNCLIDWTYYHIDYSNNLIALEIINPIYFNVQQKLFDTLRDLI